jgi:hypothetical protein
MLNNQYLKQWSCIVSEHLPNFEGGKAKKREKRGTLEVSSCFAPLLRWVISLLPISTEKIAPALDATTIGNKFVVLSINVLLAGCGIPITNSNLWGGWVELFPAN